MFLFIATLEETGYMSRVVFLMDKVMRPFGMNGKSIIPPLRQSPSVRVPGFTFYFQLMTSGVRANNYLAN